MSDSYQLWRVEAPRHSDLTFVLFHWHTEGGRCSPSVFKDVGTVMTLSEGYYTNQKILREACHAYHFVHLNCLKCACSPKVLGEKKRKVMYTETTVLFHISVLALFSFFTSQIFIDCSNKNTLLFLFIYFLHVIFKFLLFFIQYDSSPKFSE